MPPPTRFYLGPLSKGFPTRLAPEHLFHDVSAMPDPIPGTVCLISKRFLYDSDEFKYVLIGIV